MFMKLSIETINEGYIKIQNYISSILAIKNLIEKDTTLNYDNAINELRSWDSHHIATTKTIEGGV